MCLSVIRAIKVASRHLSICSGDLSHRRGRVDGAIASLLILTLGHSPAVLAEIYVTTHGLAVNDSAKYLVSLLPDDAVRRPEWLGPHVPLAKFMALDVQSRSIVIQKSSHRVLNLVIEGEITREDARQFSRFSEYVSSAKGRVLDVSLNSPGGSVLAALSIAKTIRGDAHFFANYPPTRTSVDGGICHSACVIILASGFYRSAVDIHLPDGERRPSIGIHRPVFSAAEVAAAGYQDISTAYAESRKSLRSFFESVHVDPQLVDEMYRIPSDELELISEERATDYGLLGADLVVDERYTALSRLHCGVALSDLQRTCNTSLIPFCRKALNGDPFGKCETDIEQALVGRRVDQYEAEQKSPACIALTECGDKIAENW